MENSTAVRRQYAGVRKHMRKGTRSCLACRRRKSKCTFPPDENDICIECAERDIECIPQGTKDNAGPSRLTSQAAPLESRVRRLEAQLLPHVAGRERAASEATPATTTLIEEPMNSTSAPLMRLLGVPWFGKGTSVDAQSAQTEDHSIADARRAYRQKRFSDAADDLCASMPSDRDMEDIFANKSSWWKMWRDTSGLIWGNEESDTLQEFATQALTHRNPALLGVLLVSFAISTGDLQRYLPPVERRILNDDELAATEDGLSCLMALSLCYVISLRPRRAWIVNRRANTLLQLNGIHVTHRKSPRKDSIFWQFFHADRWIALMIGLPYMVPDHFCDLEISPVGPEMPEEMFLDRRLAIITGRVIDCLQGIGGPSLSAVFEIEQQILDVTSQMPDKYLDIANIRECQDKMEKHTRLYRLIQVCLLRSYTHLPLFLRSANHSRYEFSRRGCVDDARRLLEAFLLVFDVEPEAAGNGSVLNFNAFIAAVVVLLGLLGYGRPTGAEIMCPLQQNGEDWQVLYRTMEVLKYGETGISGALCNQCYTALVSLTEIAKALQGEETREVMLPYFGTILISRRGGPPFLSQQDAERPVATVPTKRSIQVSPTASRALQETQRASPSSLPAMSRNSPQTSSSTHLMHQLPGLQSFETGIPNDISLAYHGPILSNSLVPGSMGMNSTMPLYGDGTDFTDFHEGQWSWLTGDLI